MKLYRIQFHRWPPATVIKSFGLEASEPRPLRVEPGAGSRRSCTDCSEERAQRAALQSLPRVRLPREKGKWWNTYSLVKVVPLKLEKLKAETQQKR